MEDRTISLRIVELISSFSTQIELYAQLNVCVKKMYSRIVLSRGNLQAVMGMFDEKKNLLDAISAERERVQSDVEVWQKCKNSIPDSREALRLNEVLSRVEDSIKTFLDTEQQIEQYLARLVERENGATA